MTDALQRFCANCAQFGLRVGAKWLATWPPRTKALPVCDDHRGFHQRMFEMKPLYRSLRAERKLKPEFEPA